MSWPDVSSLMNIAYNGPASVPAADTGCSAAESGLWLAVQSVSAQMISVPTTCMKCFVAESWQAWQLPPTYMKCFVAESWQAWQSLFLQLTWNVFLQKADRHGIPCSYSWCVSGGPHCKIEECSKWLSFLLPLPLLLSCLLWQGLMHLNSNFEWLLHVEMCPC